MSDFRFNSYQPYQGNAGYNLGDDLSYITGQGINQELGQAVEEQDRGKSGWNSLSEAAKFAQTAQVLRGPMGDVRQMQDFVNADPRMNQMWGKYQGALGGMSGATDLYGQGVQNYNNYSQQYLNDAFKGNSGLTHQALYGGAERGANRMMDAYGNAARQQAMGDVARSAVMSAGSQGMSGADRRAAIMGAGNAATNMGAQLAATRAQAIMQAKQQAMSQYLAARQAQLAARQSGTQMRGDYATAAGRMSDAYAQAHGSARDTLGGTISAGQNQFGQQQTAYPNVAR